MNKKHENYRVDSVISMINVVEHSVSILNIVKILVMEWENEKISMKNLVFFFAFFSQNVRVFTVEKSIQLFHHVLRITRIGQTEHFAPNLDPK